MGKVRWTEEAARWLKEVHDYIAEDNPDAAQRTARGIYNKAQELSSFPERGYRFQSAHGGTSGSSCMATTGSPIS